jgi:hypothetical protein
MRDYSNGVMIPPRSFPPGVLKLVEMDGSNVVQVHAELSSSSRDRQRIQNMRNDMLMVNPKLNLQIRENNA